MALLTSEQINDLNTRTIQARENLTLGNMREALKIFLNILKDYPGDVRTYMTLGDLYLASNQEATAMRLYSDALRIEPHNREVIRRIKLAALEYKENSSATVEQIPTEPAAIGRLLQRLTDQPALVAEEDILRAAGLLETIVRSKFPAQTVLDHLDEIDVLLPALLEINIRQARADGQPELANALGQLQENIRLQMEAHQRANERDGNSTMTERKKQFLDRFHGKVFILASEELKIGTRLDLLREALQEYGCEVLVGSQVLDGDSFRPDLVISSSPHRRQELMHTLAEYSALHIPIVLDLDCDFEELPLNHSSYADAGLGNPQVARAYLTSLMLSDRIVVTSKALEETLQAAYRKVCMIPESWSKKSDLWSKKGREHSTLNLGWISSVGQAEDLATLRRVIIRILRQYPQTQLVIAGDIKSYQMFETIPENRKIFLPSVEPEDLPYVLGQIDILLVPLRNTAFNRACSDLILLDAGIKRIPWIASPISSFQEWKAGGVVANSLDEWHVYLTQLISDPVLRSSLGDAGFHKAADRESGKVVLEWLKLLEQIRCKPEVEAG